VQVLKKPAKESDHEVKVPFTPGRMDAKQEQLMWILSLFWSLRLMVSAIIAKTKYSIINRRAAG